MKYTLDDVKYLAEHIVEEQKGGRLVRALAADLAEALQRIVDLEHEHESKVREEEKSCEEFAERVVDNFMIEAKSALRIAAIRDVFPEARWMPWDEPPVGQRVTIASREEVRGTILGRYHDPTGIIQGWWKVARHDLRDTETGPSVNRTAEGDPISVEYPPSLRPL